MKRDKVKAGLVDLPTNYASKNVQAAVVGVPDNLNGSEATPRVIDIPTNYGTLSAKPRVIDLPGNFGSKIATAKTVGLEGNHSSLNLVDSDTSLHGRAGQIITTNGSVVELPANGGLSDANSIGRESNSPTATAKIEDLPTNFSNNKASTQSPLVPTNHRGNANVKPAVKEIPVGRVPTAKNMIAQLPCNGHVPSAKNLVKNIPSNKES